MPEGMFFSASYLKNNLVWQFNYFTLNLSAVIVYQKYYLLG